MVVRIVVGRKDVANRATRVLPDRVDLIDPEIVAQVHEPQRERDQRHAGEQPRCAFRAQAFRSLGRTSIAAEAGIVGQRGEAHSGCADRDQRKPFEKEGGFDEVGSGDKPADRDEEPGDREHGAESDEEAAADGDVSVGA